MSDTTAPAADPNRKAQLLAELRRRAGTDARKLSLVSELERRYAAPAPTVPAPVAPAPAPVPAVAEPKEGEPIPLPPHAAAMLAAGPAAWQSVPFGPATSLNEKAGLGPAGRSIASGIGNAFTAPIAAAGDALRAYQEGRQREALDEHVRAVARAAGQENVTFSRPALPEGASALSAETPTNPSYLKTSGTVAQNLVRTALAPLNAAQQPFTTLGELADENRNSNVFAALMGPAARAASAETVFRKYGEDVVEPATRASPWLGTAAELAPLALLPKLSKVAEGLPKPPALDRVPSQPIPSPKPTVLREPKIGRPAPVEAGMEFADADLLAGGESPSGASLELPKRPQAEMSAVSEPGSSSRVVPSKPAEPPTAAKPVAAPEPAPVARSVPEPTPEPVVRAPEAEAPFRPAPEAPAARPEPATAPEPVPETKPALPPPHLLAEIARTIRTTEGIDAEMQRGGIANARGANSLDMDNFNAERAPKEKKARELLDLYKSQAQSKGIPWADVEAAARKHAQESLGMDASLRTPEEARWKATMDKRDADRASWRVANDEWQSKQDREFQAKRAAEEQARAAEEAAKREQIARQNEEKAKRDAELTEKHTSDIERGLTENAGRAWKSAKTKKEQARIVNDVMLGSGSRNEAIVRAALDRAASRVVEDAPASPPAKVAAPEAPPTAAPAPETPAPKTVSPKTQAVLDRLRDTIQSQGRDAGAELWRSLSRDERNAAIDATPPISPERIAQLRKAKRLADNFGYGRIAEHFSPTPDPAAPKSLPKLPKEPPAEPVREPLSPEEMEAARIAELHLPKKKSKPVTLGSGLGGIDPLLQKPETPEFSNRPSEQRMYEDLASRIRTVPKAKEPIGTRIKKAANTLYDRLIRAEGPLARGEAKMMPTGRVSPTGPTEYQRYAQGSAPRAQLNLETSGVLEGKKASKSIAEAFADVPENEAPFISIYALARRDESSYMPRALDMGFPHESASGVISATLRDRPHIARAAEALREYDRMLFDNYVEAAGISPERAQAMIDANPWYVEARRDLNSRAPVGTRTSGILKQESIPRVKGGDEPLVGPVLTVRERGTRLIAAADKARIRRKLIDLVDRNPEGAAEHLGIEEVPLRKEDRFSVQYDDILEAHKAAKGDANFTPEMVSGMIDDFNLSNKGDVFIDFAGDRPRAFKVTSDAMREWLRGDAAGDGPTAKGMEFLAKLADPISRTQRLGTTVVRPQFWPVNVVRDSGTYFMLTDAGALQATKNFSRGMYHSLRGVLASNFPGTFRDTPESSLYKTLRVEGLIGSDESTAYKDIRRHFRSDLPTRAADYVRRPWAIVGDGAGKVISIAREITAITEGAPRTGEMLTQLERIGKKASDPLTQNQRVMISNKASGITTPFRLGGRFTKFVGRFESYLNAKIQGMENVRQAWRDNPRRMATRTILYTVIPEMAVWSMIQSDPEFKKKYEDMPGWRKYGATNIPFRYSDGTVGFFSIPLPMELFAVARATVSVMNQLQKDDPRAVAEFAKEFAGAMSPVSGDDIVDVLAPGVIQPLVDVARDHQSFGGGPVNPQDRVAMRELSPQNVARPTSTSTARFLSEKLHKLGVTLTTAEIDHLMRGYLGAVSRDVTRVMDENAVDMADNPIVGRMFSRASESRIVDRFYEMAKDAENRMDTYRTLATEGNADAEGFAMTPRLVTVLSKLREAMSEKRTEYREEPTLAGKRRIAEEMRELASMGVELIESSGLTEEASAR